MQLPVHLRSRVQTAAQAAHQLVRPEVEELVLREISCSPAKAVFHHSLVITNQAMRNMLAAALAARHHAAAAAEEETIQAEPWQVLRLAVVVAAVFRTVRQQEAGRDLAVAQADMQKNSSTLQAAHTPTRSARAV